MLTKIVDIKAMFVFGCNLSVPPPYEAPPQTQPGYGYDQQYGMPRVQQYDPHVTYDQSKVVSYY
ncbi:hypothetical protein DPMN_129543 [Dreissena polymorpha]|uniref:Uncharacterized protein n=1 Tax=Dreissena polymorpha TaxID=45954 RepID=A0A9D4H1C7_DREPO|nr:hypothetical protein DPMN_129543 [Dreissena polymorpha]